MKRFFNISGPCLPDEHYMIPSQQRCKGLMELIDQKQYFVIHAARQTGKTTLLLDLANQLNRESRYHALYCTLESAQGIAEPEKGIPAVVRRLASEVKMIEPEEKYSFADNPDFSDYTNVLRTELTGLCRKLDKPAVIFFDEADCLSNGTLIAFLRQLRDGYVNRSRIPFVHSIGLIGMHNIRDYKGRIREERETLGSASPFNIVTKTLTLKNFTKEEVEYLYDQHTKDTGQIFPPEVTDSVYHWTQGQPWLANAVAREIVAEILESDHAGEIYPEHVEQAVETIMHRRDTHIDSLLERLKEDRVRRIAEPVIVGEEKGFDFTDNDYQYVLDLGLLKNEKGILLPSNPVYAEIIIRKLSSEPQMKMDSANFPPLAPAYLTEGKLDMKKLLTDFQNFWRENSEIWQERFQYKESAPHLILMAFLQRIINTGGRIDREMATGRGRIDLCIHFQNRKYPVEIKIRRDAKTLEEGRRQLTGYMDTLGCEEGWLVIFDRRKKTSWKNKLFWKTIKAEKHSIHVAGC